ncbi:MAG: hypothetical protein GY827_02505 [Cytophagales bacterium]|nr:hypothetical protein [Cytophagales bacterium]
MDIIDINQLLESLRVSPSPFKYNLYMTLMMNGVSEANPFAKDSSFLSVLTRHYKALGDTVNYTKFSRLEAGLSV